MATVPSASSLASSLVGLMLLLPGCGDEPGEMGRSSTQDSEVGELVVGHLGHVQITLQPTEDELEPEPGLQVRGRFVEYRGVSEDFARARTDLARPAWEQLVEGQCISSDALLPSAALGDDLDLDSDREIAMIDAGDLRVTMGDSELVVPLTLVPDILPWLSGVEYGHVDDRIPLLGRAPDGTSPIMVSVDGAADSGLEGFQVNVSVPVPLELQAATIGAGRLAIDWRPQGDLSRAIVLRLQAFGETDGVSEPQGEEITCLVADTGRASLALSPLIEAGLTTDAPLVRVSASRFDSVEVEAGEFGPVDVQIELRAQKTLRLD